MVFKAKLCLVFTYCYNFMAKENFFPNLNYFHKFLKCVLKIKAFLIEMVICKTYNPSQKSGGMTSNLCSKLMQFDRKLIHTAIGAYCYFNDLS